MLLWKIAKKPNLEKDGKLAKECKTLPLLKKKKKRKKELWLLLEMAYKQGTLFPIANYLKCPLRST